MHRSTRLQEHQSHLLHHVAHPDRRVRPRHKVWQKVLYERQPYDDNHVDDTFLASLVTNAHVQNYSCRSMIEATLSVVQHVCVIAIFFSVYFNCRRAFVSASFVLGVDALLAAAVYGMVVATVPAQAMPKTLDLLKSCVVFAGTLAALSPVLQTLTASFADDTIWALTIGLCALCLMFHDYGASSDVRASLRFTGTLSLNAGVLASVLLASRLATVAEVFAIEVFAIEMFALVPMARRCVQAYSKRIHAAATALVVLVTVCMLALVSTLLVSCLLMALVAWLVCPLVFASFQKYKNEIQGPWDIAKVDAGN